MPDIALNDYDYLDDELFFVRSGDDMTRNGKWILEYDGDNECDNLYKCSMCGVEYGCQEYDKPNFCFECGADMKSEVM